MSAELNYGPAELSDLLARRSADHHFVVSLRDGEAHIVFKMKADDKSYCFVNKADKEWVREFVSKTPGAVYAPSSRTFVRYARGFWPADEAVQRLKATYEFLRDGFPEVGRLHVPFTSYS